MISRAERVAQTLMGRTCQDCSRHHVLNDESHWCSLNVGEVEPPYRICDRFNLEIRMNREQEVAHILRETRCDECDQYRRVKPRPDPGWCERSGMCVDAGPPICKEFQPKENPAQEP